jgi:hypothetical protein
VLLKLQLMKKLMLLLQLQKLPLMITTMKKKVTKLLPLHQVLLLVKKIRKSKQANRFPSVLHYSVVITVYQRRRLLLSHISMI